ncbi:Hsp20/alpha crystallin family protein [Bacillus lacus]|uniref:Hsp20/alpha crystallin family protein n=1 Tax=Metabacillus lacus TaxID=1983721 RepID=A0A7X2IVZ7_9BACI|nr:Hsp20/alpha crystallin family protein [Metabacillus lacus]MRX70709.1 Hsp20/alpha crystallin family protein [Metabacillus lacus]
MDKRKYSMPSDLECFEEWVEQFFEDPFTSALDEYSFRIDLFETSTTYIIEAEISSAKLCDIQVRQKGKQLFILVNQNQHLSERYVELPFTLSSKHIYGTYQNGILEIVIDKENDVGSTPETITIDAAEQG